MQKKLTITLDEKVYDGLHRVVGRGKISRFIEGLVRPHVHATDLDASYRELALFEKSNDEALEWVEGVAGDVGDLTESTTCSSPQEHWPTVVSWSPTTSQNSIE